MFWRNLLPAPKSATGSSEKLVDIYQNTRRCTSEDLRYVLISCACVALQSSIIKWLLFSGFRNLICRYTRFEVLTAVVMKNCIFRDMTTSNPLKGSVCYMLHSGFLLGLFFDMLYRQVGFLSTDYMALYFRRYNFYLRTFCTNPWRVNMAHRKFSPAQDQRISQNMDIRTSKPRREVLCTIPVFRRKTIAHDIYCVGTAILSGQRGLPDEAIFMQYVIFRSLTVRIVTRLLFTILNTE
jgi:hypothetical protein